MSIMPRTKEEQRAIDAEKKRLARRNETAEQRQERLHKEAETRRARKSRETEEQAQERRKAAAAAKRKKLANETDEEKQERRNARAAAYRKARENETEEQSQQRRNARVAANRENARRKKFPSGSKEIQPKLNSSEISKLVPASINDFKNILNESTGLSISRVTPIVTNEADRLEIEALEEPMDTEGEAAKIEDKESPSVVVQINSCPPSLQETESRASSYAVEQEATAAGVQSTAKLDSDVNVTPGFDSTKTEDIHPLLSSADLEISVQNVFRTNDSAYVAVTLLGSKNKETDHIPGTCDVNPQVNSEKTEANSFNYLQSLAQALQEKLKSSIQSKTRQNLNDNSECSMEIESCVVNSKLEESQRNRDNEQTAGVSCVSPLPKTEILPSITETNLDVMVVKEELPTEYDDADQRLHRSHDIKIESEEECVTTMMPECIFIKEEYEDSGNNEEDEADKNSKYQVFNEYNTPAPDVLNRPVYELRHEVNLPQQGSMNQIPSPLKPLFGSALVSLLKQKIQEKIQAAVGASNEENNIVERENDINTKGCINLSLSFNEDSEIQDK